MRAAPHPGIYCLLLTAALFVPAAVKAQQAVRPAMPERAGSLTCRDPRLGQMPTRRWEMSLTPNPVGAVGPDRDPKRNVFYPFKLQVKCLDKDDRVAQRFVVHFLQEADHPLARRVGSVMARLYWIVLDYLGRGPAENEYINVWLTHDGRAGGEELRRNIYLLAIDEPRAPAEWVRELAHEYAHITLPRAGEYSTPESWANGYLGERLFLKWLLFDNGQTGIWDQPIDAAAYVANQVVPLRERVLNEGPSSPAAARMDAEGMDFFIGEMLVIEAAYGPAVLRQILDNFNTPRPQNLGLYFTTVLEAMKHARLAIDPAVWIPARSQPEPGAPPGAGPRFKKASYWLFLTEGIWRIEVRGALPDGTRVRLSSASLKPARPSLSEAVAWEATLLMDAGGWHRLDLIAPAGSSVVIRQMQVSRKESAG